MNCLNCNIETKNPKYCSKKCSLTHTSESRRLKLIKGTCKICGVITRNRWSRCDDCRNKFHAHDNTPNCIVCGVTKTTENCIRRTNGTGWNPYCKLCTVDIQTLRRRECKQICLDYKYSRCERCGYDKCPASLQFHHIDPDKKDFTISGNKRIKLTDEIKNELDKCIVLCANCHFEHHYNQIQIDQHVLDYYSNNFLLK